ncbi:(deoxy)nucleoside triphosphate pyrophosphohydrolase [Spirochaeta dissipatitropha]
MKTIEVAAAVLEHKGTFFCAQRAESGEEAMKWEFPGGKVETGELHSETLVREFKEELAIRITPGLHLLTVEHSYPTYNLRMYVYMAHLSGCKVEDIRLHEHKDAQWLSPYEMKKLDWASADLPVVERLIHEETAGISAGSIMKP